MPRHKQGQDCPQCGGTNPDCAYSAKFGELGMTNAACSMTKSPSGGPEAAQVSYVRSFQAQINNLLDEINGATSDLEKRITAVLMPSRPTDTSVEERKAAECETSTLAEELAVVKARLEQHLAFINDLRDRVDL